MAPNGASRSLPTNLDLADILGRMDLNFDILFVFLGPQLSGFPGLQISKLPDFQVPRSPNFRFPSPQISRFPEPAGAASVLAQMTQSMSLGLE